MPMPGIDLQHALELYEENRFLDAYHATRPVWDPGTAVEELSIEELIHGGRLAHRLGSGKIQRWLWRTARARAPEHPLVRYFTRWLPRGRSDLLAGLIEFERRPELGSGDPHCDASWLGDQAQTLASVRDFERAHQILDRAKEMSADRAWVIACEAWVLCYEDRWADALRVAEAAWERSEGMPSAAAVLGKVLTKLGRLDEAADRLSRVAEGGQSYETLGIALWYRCALAERSAGPQRQRQAARVYELSARLYDLAPLADRDTRRSIACARLDAAMLLGDRPRMEQHAAEAHSPYGREVLRNLRKNPEGREVLLPYRPVYQKHLTCLPSSIAAVVGAFDIHLDEGALAQAMTFDGTPIWLAVDWLNDNGFPNKPFIATPDLARTLLTAGLPFVYMTESASASHAAAAVGIDEASGTLIIHDPSSERLAHVLIDRMSEDDAPLGPEALAVVPPDRTELLDLIPAAASRPLAVESRYRKILETKGARAASEVVDAAARDDPDQPYARRLRAHHLARTGELYAAIQMQEALLAEMPNCALLRKDLLGALSRTEDAVRIRKTLEDIVRRGKLPGIRENQAWRYPPAVYVAQYADHLGVTAEGFRKAEKLLLKALRREPFYGTGYHILGDIYARQGRHAEAAMPFRLAATLEDENPHFARAAADAMRQAGREDEGLRYLQSRARRLGGLARGPGAWITWIDALEDYGRPDEAIEAAGEAQARRPTDAGFHSYMTEFWIRMGRWDHAHRSLAKAEATGHRPLYLEAAVRFQDTAGRWEEALRLCEQWVDEAPDYIRAREYYLRLLSKKRGRRPALDLARQWAREQEDRDPFEDLYYRELDRQAKDEQAEGLLRARLDRNPLDAWGWRELAHRLLQKAQQSAGQAREAVLAEAERVIAESDRHHPDCAGALALKARLAGIRGDDDRAVELFLEALWLDPDYSYCYQTIWDNLEASLVEKQREVLAALEERLLRTVGQLHNARALAFRIAERFGVQEAERAVQRWQSRAGDDPEVIEARVDLLLHYGRGRSDAQRAVEILEPAIERFPNHFDLRFSLAHAYGVLLRGMDQIEVLREIIRRQPLNMLARRHLAEVLARTEEPDEAVTLLEEGIGCDPQDPDVRGWLTDLLWNHGRQAESLDALRRAVEAIPEDVGLREQLIDRLQDVGEHREAVGVAEGLVGFYPDGAYCWYVLARARHRSDVHTDVSQVEADLRKALELNFALFQAADLLSSVLAAQRRFPEARQVVRERISSMADPSIGHAQLAWITRREGNDAQAVDEMAEVVRRWPSCRWAWQQLMDWLEADEQWDRARSLLTEVHPVTGDDPTFCSRRLMLLQRAGAGFEELDPQWKQLLDDFPENQTLHLQCFDILAEREAWDRAEEVLSAAERFHPISPYVLARRVRLLANAGSRQKAIDTALTLWQLPGDEDIWPEETAWEAFQQAGMASEATQAAYDLVMAGVRIRRKAFERVVAWIPRMNWPRSFWRRINPFRWLWEPYTDVLTDLLAALDRADWDAGSCTAAVLETLHDWKATRRALEYWESHKGQCRSQRCVWQAMSYILAGCGASGRRKLREWMADWREHQGVEMWAVANYLMSLRKVRGLGEDLGELYASARDALERLPHDQTARYQACVLCEAALRLRHDEEFLGSMDRYGGLLEDDSSGFWMEQGYKWAPDVLGLFRDLLTTRDVGERKALHRRFRVLAPSCAKRWVRREWRRRL